MTANNNIVWLALKSIATVAAVITFFAIAAHANGPVIGLERAKVWAKPQVLAKTVGEVKYGTKIKVLETKNGWVRIETASAPKVSGWVMKNAIESRAEFAKAIGSGEALDSSYGSQDVAAAGKGWDPNVEKSHRQGNPKLDYASVDAMEAINYGPDDFTPAGRAPASAFQKTGKLSSKIYGAVK
ncbi:MAG TPA: SH3 domain-containing protein [Bdellovibrionales bacterium]|nr:SH3 domain-containing protein [Bdellovibrionales bacterium]